VNVVGNAGALAGEFWRWRAETRPDTTDDLPRMERPIGWLPEWSAAAVAAHRRTAAAIAARLAGIDTSDLSVADQVDARLLRSALDRVRWELDVHCGWQRNPGFYLDQAIVPIFETLLPPAPFDGQRAQSIIDHLANLPVLLEDARANLTRAAPLPFARLAIEHTARLGTDLRQAMGALAAHLPDRQRGELPKATAAAIRALNSYRRWLVAHVPDFGGPVAIGAAAFGFFLHRVALYPHPAQHVASLARTEWQRAAAAEAVLTRRSRCSPAGVPATSAAAIVSAAADAEAHVRRFYDETGILSQPATLRHYRLAPMPAYLAPLCWFAVPDDLTSQRRLSEDALRYVATPGPDMSYFELSTACDPLVGKLAHEGVHAQQLALSWRHPNPVRRHYYDSLPNEGIAFYHEEMALLAGMFDGRPHAARYIANFLKLRALRAELDVGVAVGTIAIEEASERLMARVPLDAQAARHHVAALAATPGQQLSYQAGKQQILDLLADACQHFGESFDLRRFHDRLWSEGNVPLALQRWELLGDPTQLRSADQLAGRAAQRTGDR
jgi:Bacterial protein of unknown function (DUF885)